MLHIKLMVGNAFDDGKKSVKIKSGSIKTMPVNHEWLQNSKFTYIMSTSKCLNLLYYLVKLLSMDYLCGELCVCACYSKYAYMFMCMFRTNMKYFIILPLIFTLVWIDAHYH